ncbi:MAG: FtsX-like permease family protein [Candidatus Heimdallarchaeota archaeon]|nr:MAG: FtsX-like permease family protein [Candidatus Heimdallarchaeota archaeon]
MSIALSSRNVSRNRWRTFLIITGIAISVGLETGIAITIDSLYTDFIESHRGNNFTDITIHPKEKTTIDQMRNLTELIRTVPGVEKASPVVTATYIEALSSSNDIPNNSILYGLEPDSHPDYQEMEVSYGGHSLEPGQVIISHSIANAIEKDPGHEYCLNESSEFYFRGGCATISGLLNDNSHFGNYIGYVFILLNLDYMLGLFSNTTYLNFHLAVKVDDFLGINAIAEKIEFTGGVGLEYYVYREKSISQNDVLGIRTYQAAMNLIIIASFVIEFLFIANILGMNIRERSPEFGILRAIGTSNRQIFLYLFVEILIYSGIGSIIGIFIGLGFSVMLVGFLNLNFPRVVIGALIIHPKAIITTYITGIIIALISGLYPIFIAISLPVVQNIHWKTRRKTATTRNWILFIMAGTLFAIVGSVTTYILGPSRFLSFEVLSWHFFAVISVLFGTFLLEIGLLHFLPRLGRKLMFWHNIVPRTIATKNISREFQKSSITIMVTALALTFILVIGIISSAIIETVPEYYKERYGKIDIIAETKDNAHLPLSFVDELVSNNTNIERAAFMQQQRTLIEKLQGYVFGITPDSFEHFFNNTILAPTDPNIPELFNSTERGTIISHLLRDRIGAKIGDNLTVQVTLNSSTEVKITGIASGNPFLQGGSYIFFSDTLFQEFWQNSSANWFIMSTSKDRESLKTIVERLSLKYSDFKEVISIDFYKKVIEKSLIIQTAFFQILFLHTFILSGLAQFICILISTLRMEREMGIMRALGLSKGEVFSTFFAESSLLGIAGVGIGIINGIIGAELVAWYISQSIPIETDISLQLIFFWVCVSLAITVTSTIIPSYRSSCTNVANAIHNYTLKQRKKRLPYWANWEKLIDDYLEKRHEMVSSHIFTQKNKKEQ